MSSDSSNSANEDTPKRDCSRFFSGQGNLEGHRPTCSLYYAALCKPGGFARHLDVSQASTGCGRIRTAITGAFLGTTWHRGLAHKLADDIRPAYCKY